MKPVEMSPDTSPVVLAFPHTGTHVLGDIADHLNENGRILSHTDCHVGRLYLGPLPDAMTVRATFHRYVIDANRDPSGQSLYPGQNTTGLVPLTDFDNRPIWLPGGIPSEADVAQRLAQFHVPYHAAPAAEVEQVKAKYAVGVCSTIATRPAPSCRSCSREHCPVSASARTLASPSNRPRSH